MSFKKTKDLCVTTGKYTDSTGQQKNRYQNVGYILEDETGAKMIMLNRSFNPAGVPFKEGSEAIIISQFDIKERDGAAPVAQTVAGGGQDIPF